MRRSSAFYLLAFIALLGQGCDTKSTIDAPGNDYFLKYFGNEGAQTGVDMVVNADGTIVLFGTQQKPDANTRFYVAKSDASGNMLWEKTFGGPLECEARDIELTSSGDLVIVGNILTSPGNNDLFLMRLNQDGGKIGDSVTVGYKVYGTGANAGEDVSTVTQINDGGFIVAGSTDKILNSAPSIQRQAFFTRFGADLSIKGSAGDWQDNPVYGTSESSAATKVFPGAVSGYNVFGSSKFKKGAGPQSDFNFWYFSLSETGDPATSLNTIGAEGLEDILQSAEPLLGGGFVLTGVQKDPSGNADIFIAAIRNAKDSLSYDDKDLLGSSVLFSPGTLKVSLGAIRTTRVSQYSTMDEGHLILTNEFTNGNQNILLMKVDFNAKPAWGGGPSIFGGQGDDEAGAVTELPDGKILVVGTMAIGQINGETKMVLIKLNKDGQFAK